MLYTHPLQKYIHRNPPLRHLRMLPLNPPTGPTGQPTGQPTLQVFDQTDSYAYTGVVVYFTVPSAVYAIRATGCGGLGGGGPAGGCIRAMLGVTPGDILDFDVGGPGGTEYSYFEIGGQGGCLSWWGWWCYYNH